MRKKIKNIYTVLCFCLLAILASCNPKSGGIKIKRMFNGMPDIFPDYIDVTIPPNMAPLNFVVRTKPKKSRAIFSSGSEKFIVKGNAGSFCIPMSKWRKMLEKTAGGVLQVTVQVWVEKDWASYPSFEIHVAEEKIDSYLAYRLIDPGYELWNEMGIYQRNLENYKQTAIVENKMTGSNCMNCHSFCMQNPDKMLFHMRATYPGTLLLNDGKVEKLNTKTEETLSALVYPSWHSSGKYVAFSVNNTRQAFHMNDKNRIEVYDDKSDVVVYDVQKHEIVTSPHLSSQDALETFPTFSPDGKRLFFCTTVTRPIPQEYDKAKYSLCSVAFDPSTRSFGESVDTLYNAGTGGRSASFPRVSPDGRYLLYTLSDYGNFSIWHNDADLYIADLSTGTSRPLTEVNSSDVESYHSWSSNSRWFVFSSRRTDGLYTCPFIAYMGADGKAGKPFMLPQKHTGFYLNFMKSYNIPEFVTGKVTVGGRKFAVVAKKEKGTDVRFVK